MFSVLGTRVPLKEGYVPLSVIFNLIYSRSLYPIILFISVFRRIVVTHPQTHTRTLTHSHTVSHSLSYIPMCTRTRTPTLTHIFRTYYDFTHQDPPER